MGIFLNMKTSSLALQIILKMALVCHVNFAAMQRS